MPMTLLNESVQWKMVIEIAYIPSNATNAKNATERTQRTQRIAASILCVGRCVACVNCVCCVFFLRPLRSLRSLRTCLGTFLAPPAPVASKSTQGRCVRCVGWKPRFWPRNVVAPVMRLKRVSIKPKQVKTESDANRMGFCASFVCSFYRRCTA